METQTIIPKLTQEEQRQDRLNLIRERFKERKGNTRLTAKGAAILASLEEEDDGEELAGAGKTALAGLIDLEEAGEREDGEAGHGLDADDESEKNTAVISPLMREATP